MNERTTVHSTYYNPIEANIIKTRIEAAGFACFLADENLATLNPLYNQAIGGVRLIIFERDQEKINELLAEDSSLSIEDEQHLNTDTVCPKCGSHNVSFGLATKRKYSWWVTLLSFLTVSHPILANKCYHCYNCGHEFE
ncbi:putative signal transducing protein [Pedobacter sp. MW01-1-1]|uniref:putative signal transducing protein n=1 Tax=Pedobacter sp. MW01-1-1 TaxID=3383027 RepID=UPI003FEEB175